MAIKVVVEGSRFCVQTQGFCTQWLPDTPINRQVTLVWLRLLMDEEGQRLFTLQELAVMVDSANRQAASQHMEDFRECGEEFRAFVRRRRKIDETVVQAVESELMKRPLMGPQELAQRVNERLRRRDVTAANMPAAVEQISYARLWPVVRQQLEGGRVHYQEGYLLEEMMESLSTSAGQAAGLAIPPSDQGMYLSDPTAVRVLLDPDVPIHQISGSVAWMTVLMTLFYWNVPLSVLGRWMGVHKTTVLRWIMGLALSLWPTVYGWILDRVKAKMVYIDEKWIKIRGRWRYWYVVLDVETELPVLAALLPSRTRWACRWLGCQLNRIKKVPHLIITDGLRAYDHLWPGVKHVLCRFHHQQNVTQWLNKHFTAEADITKRKPLMKKLFQTSDKRTVRRRLARLSQQAPELGLVPWITTVMEKLPSLIGTIGSVRLPSTTNAIERFFRAFNRFYKTRGGFHSLISAKRELILFLVVYLFTQRSTDGRAPIERIIPEASRMPLYRLINDPFRSLRQLGHVKEKANMADFLLTHVAAA